LKKIRKSAARNEEFGSASLDLPQGAHLKTKSVKVFGPKFDDETGDFWIPKIRARMVVVNDRTEDGEADGLEFDDYFELKLDPDLWFEPDDIRNANIRDFDEEEQALLLDEDTWTIGAETKADNLNIAIIGKDWDQKVDFHPEIHWVGKEIIAKVKPRTGKKAGSYCGWDTFMSLEPPQRGRKGKGKSKVQKAQEEAQQVDLSPEEEKLLEEALPS
jgi:hypothetical protein